MAAKTPTSSEKVTAKPKVGKAALKRQSIIDAAAVVFRKRGYAQATLAEIAAEAGTQAGSLYYYFDSREQLVEEVLTYSTIRLTEVVDTTLDSLPEDADSLTRLMAVIRAHVLTVLNRDDYSIAYQKIHDQVTSEMRDRIARVPRAYGRFWTGLFKDAVRDGFLKADLDPRLTRLLLIGSISWMADWYKGDGPSGPDEIADSVLRLFFEGAAVDRDLIATRLGPKKRHVRRRRTANSVADTA